MILVAILRFVVAVFLVCCAGEEQNNKDNVMSIVWLLIGCG
jgi:hypothetical protein